MLPDPSQPLAEIEPATAKDVDDAQQGKVFEICVITGLLACGQIMVANLLPDHQTCAHDPELGDVIDLFATVCHHNAA